MEEDTEYLKLPVEDRVIHKLWKARLHGYEEVTKLFRQLDDEKSPEFSKYLGLVKKFVVDSNAVAQEKGLEATLAFVECYALAGKTVGEVMSGIVNKCIAAPKTKTKELAVQVTLMYIEIEKQDIVQEELIKGMEAKNPKISSACVSCMTQALREFGSKIVNIKPLVKKISALLEDRDKAVREEGKSMVIEMYRWVGEALKPQLNSLKPVQLSELESEFGKGSGVRAVPTRYVRSQQQREAKVAAEGGALEEGAVCDEVDAPTDAYDLAEAVDILSQLSKDFYEKVEAKKWQERKEALDSLEQLLQTPKLEAGDYGDLVRALKKIISKDSNVVVVTVAVKCLGGLANGLKKRFSTYAGACIPAILEKFKEKKQTVVVALKEAIDAIYPSTNIENIQEDVIAALDSKNPSVKSETASFLARSFTHCTPTMLNKKVLKAYATVLLKMLNDPDPTVRENAAEALGTAMKVVGEKAMAPLMTDVENIKLTKIKECCDRAVIVAKVSVRPVSAPAKVESKSEDAKPVKRPVTGAAKKPPQKKLTANAAPAAGGNKGRGPSKSAERDLTPEEVEERGAALLGDDVLSGLGDTNWKTRLTAVEQFVQALGSLELKEGDGQVLLKVLNKKPGLKDNNFQVQKARLEAVKSVVEVTQPLSSAAVESVVGDVAVTLADPKNGGLAGEVLLSLSEATRLEAVSTLVLNFAFSQKSPKVQQEALAWLGTAIMEFGFCLKPKEVMDYVRKAVDATNPAVRSAGIALTGILSLYLGRQLLAFFDNDKPALQQLIYLQIEKHANEEAPNPRRGAARSERASPTPSDDALAVPISELMPHADISHLITDQLISEFKNRDWKVRQEALTKVEGILAGNRLISGDLGDLPAALALGLVDSNGKIAASTFAICQALGPALGSQGRQHLRLLFPAFLQGLGDSKPSIRAAALTCVNTWAEHVGLRDMFEGEMIADALKAGTPQLRAELWLWLSEVLPKLPAKSIQREELTAVLPHVYSNLEDRHPEVRKSCQEAVAHIMLHLGYVAMARGTDKLKPGSRIIVAAVLDKALATLPPERSAPGATSVRGGGKKGDAAAPAKINSNTVTRPASSKSAQLKKGVAGKPGGRRKEEEVDSSPLLQLNTTKNQRSIDEQKLKVLKWNFTQPRDEFVELLKEQMQVANVNKNLIANMFHSDFKFHLKAIDALSEDLPINAPATVANLDLILKWMTLRFFDTNPSVLLKGLEYLQTVFAMLIEEEYHMFEFEASSFIPYLIIKIGDPKDAVRIGVRALFKQLQCVYPATKLFANLMDGLKSKNARQRTECLDQLGSLIETFGMTVCQPSPAAALREIARQISDRDNSVRNAALNCVVQAFYLEGDKVYRMVGQISDKDSSLLEERIKRASKNRVAPRAPPAPGRHQQRAPPEPEPPEPEAAPRQRSPSQSPSPPPPMHAHTRTAVVKPRPVSGPFGLDFELLERIEGDGIGVHAPELAEFDLNEILSDAPCRPPPPAGARYPVLSPPKPLQPAGRLSSATTADQAVDCVVKGIANHNLRQAFECMIQMDALLGTDKAPVLVNKVDSLILACVMQLRLLNQKSLVTTPLDQLCKGYRTLLMLIMALYKNAGLCERVGKDALRDLVDHLLRLLVDDRLEELDGGESFIKVINVLVVKIIEKSDHTTVCCALIKSLHECVANANTPPRVLDLVMKCLWKVIKLLPVWESKLAFNVVLKDIHCFFKDFPSVMWKKRGGGTADLPMRTVKTVLHTMVKLRGNRILLELDQIDNCQESELESYLMRLIRAVKCEPSHPSPPKKEKRLSRNTHELLSEIFRKIGTKSETNEGLQALYDFKTTHPEADIEPFLAKSSAFFQKYIEEGMQSIELSRKSQNDVEAEFENKESKALSPSIQTTPGSCDDDDGNDKDAQYYLMKLRSWQQQAGIEETNNILFEDNTQADDNRNNQCNEMRILPPIEAVPVPAPPPSTASLDVLRQRLEQLKSSSART